MKVLLCKFEKGSPSSSVVITRVTWGSVGTDSDCACNGSFLDLCLAQKEMLYQRVFLMGVLGMK